MDMERYRRQTALAEVGVDGQRKLAAATVLVIGAGALGLPAAQALAGAGVGRIRIADGDVVALDNLHRQLLFTEADLGKHKVEVAAQRMRAMNSTIAVEAVQEFLRASNARKIASGCDLIIDAADNFPCRYLVNDLGCKLRVPVVHGSVLRFQGMVTVLAPHTGGPCYRCIWPQPPAAGTVPTCAEAGVIGALPGIIGNWQAIEAVKWILGHGEPLAGRVLAIDALAGTTRTLPARRDPQCRVCSQHPESIQITDDLGCGCAVPWMTAPATNADEEIDCAQLAEILGSAWRGLLIDVRERGEHERGNIPGSRLIPLSTLPQVIDTLRDQAESGCEIILHCQGGVRSAKALAMLRNAGIPRCRHLRGGYNAWQNHP